MYNGIGLTTPRGSGTNGYVVRNLSALRSHQTSQDRASAWETAPPKHREPDEAILEHERKRKVEVKCLELQLELEDKGVDEEEIEQKVGALREELLKNLAALAPSAKSLKASDTHGIAVAKKAELNKMARAFGTRSDYQEGDAFDREKQEEIRIRKQAEREERDKKKEEERIRYQEQKAKWEAEKRERDRLRRREEDRLRRERGGTDSRLNDAMPPPSIPPAKLDRGGNKRESRDRDRVSYHNVGAEVLLVAMTATVQFPASGFVAVNPLHLLLLPATVVATTLVLVLRLVLRSLLTTFAVALRVLTLRLAILVRHVALENALTNAVQYRGRSLHHADPLYQTNRGMANADGRRLQPLHVLGVGELDLALLAPR
ncbi:hypothetical protein H0H92_004796 [Tricholoma furcatifolium]|nr:hypothetical protein H0H92_004796 [Tricholoma furcatifolium]